MRYEKDRAGGLFSILPSPDEEGGPPTGSHVRATRVHGVRAWRWMRRYNDAQGRSPLSAKPTCLAAARSPLGSDSHLGCHSLPRGRFATKKNAALLHQGGTTRCRLHGKLCSQARRALPQTADLHHTSRRGCPCRVFYYIYSILLVPAN